jgi:threonine/homoserine/homoserine lactone efflux protein
MISILGGFYLGYLSYESFKTKGLTVNIGIDEPRSLQKGATVNFLNPSPYIFWIIIGSPMLLTAYNESLISMFIFLGGFYACLVGSKIVLACLIGKSRDFLTDKPYIYIIRIIGLILILFALYFIHNGINLLMID